MCIVKKKSLLLSHFSISGPEQVTLGVQQAWNTWTEVEHRYSLKNLGPSPLEKSEILAFVPAIIHRNEPLVTNITVWVGISNRGQITPNASATMLIYSQIVPKN